MNHQARIRTDLQAAMKAGDTVRRETLRILLATLTHAEMERGELNDADFTAVVRREAKRRREAIEAFQAGGREDRAQQEQQELAVLEGYLPPPLSDDQIRALAQQAIAKAPGEPNLGQVMGQVMGQVKDQADGASVRRIVSELLEQG